MGGGAMHIDLQMIHSNTSLSSFPSLSLPPPPSTTLNFPVPVNNFAPVSQSSSSYYPSGTSTRNGSVVGKEEKTASEYSNRDIFGLVPSHSEVEGAMTALHNFMKGISSSDLELVHLLQTLGCGDIRKSLSHGYARLLNAFGLLQREPIIMRVVMSLSSDKAVWDAVMNNELVRQLRESCITPAVTRRIQSCNEGEDVVTCMLRGTLPFPFSYPFALAYNSMASSIITISSMLFTLVMALETLAPQAEAARAFFVFGDSLVDNGNNNYLATTARADSPPYGIDFPTHRPTGRFSNGLNIPDYISREIGSDFLLPYLSPELTGQKLLVGANFASAGIGILNDTGIQFVNIIRMFQQYEYFEEYQRRVTALIGPKRTQQLVNGALVLITVGGNDFVNNYYLVPYSVRSRQYRLPDYVKFLISEYKKLLMRLYELGARRVLVTGTGPLGCVPAELATRSRDGECSAELQRAASLFNPQLTQMLGQLNSQYGSDVFIAANTGKMSSDFITNPAAFGFITSKVACCGQGPYNGVGLCTPASNLCPNRDVYAFWDPFHPSERANGFIVQEILRGTTEYMNPMNLSTILALDSRT